MEQSFDMAMQAELNNFSLEEAQAFFREEAEQASMQDYSLDDDSYRTLSPGDFVPEWDAATAAVRGGLACYNVPITTTYRFKAVSVEERGVEMKASKVNVYQKLVIVKDLYTEKKSQYILTLIPTPSYEARYGSSTVGNFVNCGEKQGYSGLAIYTCVYSPFTVRVSRYQTGHRVEGTFLFSPETRNVQSNKAELARALTSSVIVQRRKVTVTRSEDSNWDIDGGWLDEVVITPDDGDDDMEKWLEQWRKETRPEIVDPEPEEEIPEEPYDEGAQSDNSKDDGQKNGNKDLDSQVNDVKKELEKMGINFSNINIKIITKTEGNSVTNARRYADGTIEIYPRFGQWENIETQTAILWHEIYHLRNDRPISTDKSIQIEPPIKIEPPDDIKAIIEERIIKQTGFSEGSFGFDYAYQDEITFKSVSPIYADNEYNCYISEKEIFPDNLLDKEYVDERNYNIWYYGTELQVLKEHQNR